MQGEEASNLTNQTTGVKLRLSWVRDYHAAEEMVNLFRRNNLQDVESYLKSGRYARECQLNAVEQDNDTYVIHYGSDLLAQVAHFYTFFECQKLQLDRQRYGNQVANNPNDGYSRERLQQVNSDIAKFCNAEKLKAQLEFQTAVLLMLVRDGTAFQSKYAYGLAELLTWQQNGVFRAIIASEINYETWIEIAKVVVGETVLRESESNTPLSLQATNAVHGPRLAALCLRHIVNPEERHVKLIEKLETLVETVGEELLYNDAPLIENLRGMIPDIETTAYWRYQSTGGAKGRCVREIIDVALGLVGSSLLPYEMLWIIEEALPTCAKDDPVSRPILSRFRVVRTIERIIERHRESLAARLLSERQKKKQASLNHDK